jgi:hypothetical protein
MATKKRQTKQDDLIKLFLEHQAEDRAQFQLLHETLKPIAHNVESLMETRTFMRGTWKAISVVAGAASVVTTIVIAVIKAFAGVR